MNITDVRLRKLPIEGKLKAIVSVTFNNEFVLHDIKIIEGNESLFLAMPSRRLSNGEYRDIAHPINAEARKELEDVIFKEYYAVKEKLDSEEMEKPVLSFLIEKPQKLFIVLGLIFWNLLSLIHLAYMDKLTMSVIIFWKSSVKVSDKRGFTVAREVANISNFYLFFTLPSY